MGRDVIVNGVHKFMNDWEYSQYMKNLKDTHDQLTNKVNSGETLSDWNNQALNSTTTNLQNNGMPELTNPAIEKAKQIEAEKAAADKAAREKPINDEIARILAQEAPQATVTPLSNQDDQIRTQQVDFLNALKGQLDTTPLADAQTKRALEGNLKSAMAQSAAMRGMGAGANQRILSQNLADVNQRTAQSGFEQALQEQAAKQQLYANSMYGTRAADITKASANAQLANQIAMANITSKLQTMGMTNDSIARMLGFNVQTDISRINAALQQEANRIAEINANTQASANDLGWLGAIGAGLGGLLGGPAGAALGGMFGGTAGSAASGYNSNTGSTIGLGSQNYNWGTFGG